MHGLCEPRITRYDDGLTLVTKQRMCNLEGRAMAKVFTIGYERATFEDFARTLVDAGVSVVIDVRAWPHSRRREFAYKHLGPGLAEYGIRYESWPALGTPAEGREAAKRGDMEAFARVFEAQLATPAAREALVALGELAEQEAPCLLCYERDPAQCHRTLVGARLQAEQADIAIHDLLPVGPETAGSTRRDRFTWGPGDIEIVRRGDGEHSE